MSKFLIKLLNTNIKMCFPNIRIKLNHLFGDGK